MKMWLFVSQQIPLIVFKAETAEEAKKRLSESIRKRYRKQLMEDPTLKIVELTLEELDTWTSDEFKIDSDTGF